MVDGARATQGGRMGPSELYRRAGLLAAGHTDNELRRHCRTGALTLVRRGHYLPGAPPDDEVASTC